MAKIGTKAAFPGFIPPALATTQASPPEGAAWVHELKLDGYRLQGHIQSGQVQLFTRKGLDWTARFPSLTGALQIIPVQSAIVDSEVAVHDATGVPRPAALQEGLSLGRGPFVYYAFDLLYLDDRDFRDLPLLERKARLAELVAGPDLVKYSEHFEDGRSLWRLACSIGAEGVMSKRRDDQHRHSLTVSPMLHRAVLG